MKYCPRCKLALSLDSFGNNRARYDGKQNICKGCRKTASAKDYQDNSKKYVDRAALQREAMRKIVREAKDHPCMDCGVSYPPYVMDFDHRPDEVKLGNIAELTNQVGRAKLEAEIKKCDVVCANCHRLRTWHRGACNGNWPDS